MGVAFGAGPILAACTPAVAPIPTPVGVVPTPTVPRLSGELKILVWSHFVPRYDEWFDAFAKDWGAENGVTVTVDHIGLAELRSRTAAEISAEEGHDIIELLDPPADFEPSVLDLTDLNQEAVNRFGPQVALCTRSTFNPTTNVFYGFCHGWVPDPGDYRKSLWEQVGFPNGPSTWEELLEGGAQIKEQLGVQMGIGMSNEIDSNMAGRAILWSFGASIQDENENVVINSPEAVAAVEYMVQLFQRAMTDEVFSWTAASNNQLLIAGQASYILNSVSAYRSAQKAQPEIADDVFFTPSLTGPGGIGLASEHVIPISIIPKFVQNPDAAKEFLLHLVANYDKAVFESELYNFPAFFSTAPNLLREGGWLDDDPFRSNPRNKLDVLKTAEQWSTNIGYPGPANAAEGEIFATFVIPNMFAKAARGELSPADAVAEAESLINPIFAKWRAEGLVGGGS
ncbi:MAG: extracellular solute-binding protein [Chloroflexi bacterium]|nr:extracellular solute-binding protein [Chloroflexota bacterium]